LSGTPPPPEIVVVGSINQDYLLRVDHRPGPGETVGNATLVVSGGGKGANQAVAAAAYGVATALVARLGDDPSAETLARELAAAGVDLRWMKSTPGTESGAAFITVTPDGENQIVVAPGANARLGAPDIAAAAEVIAQARVLLLQLEIRLDTVEAAVTQAGPSTSVVLNAAPASPLPSAIRRRVDVLVVNQHEAATLLGTTEPDAWAASEALRADGTHTVIVTAGAAGATTATAGRTWHQPAPPAQVVDTTGAGDAFVGALAARLAATTGRPPDYPTLHEAVAEAVRAASRSVGRVGARTLR
jgi:ribokinase